MLLMNKFVRIYSCRPYVILTILFNILLLLREEEQAVAVNTSFVGDEHQHSNSTVNPNSTQNDEGANGGGGGDVAEIYVAVIYPKSKETVFSHVIKQTVSSLSEDFTTATNLRIVPHYTAISDTEGYSVEQVEQACTEWNHKPIIAAVVFSSFKSGFGHVLTSLHNNIPVLWATGELQPGYFERAPLSRFEVRLDPGSYEVLRSLRSLLLATHWHAFTVMHTTSLLASRTYKDIINQPPLLPTIIQFRPDSTSYYIFRLLSDVSKSTKGVIVLICEASDAKRVIQESKKLNMINGDFVWLWIDTSAMLINDRSIRLEKMKESSYVVEMRKVRHAPTFHANETKTGVHEDAAALSPTNKKKPPRCRDNNGNNVVTAGSTTVFCSYTNHSDLHENKTDIRLYANDNIDNNYFNSNNVLRYTNSNQVSVLPPSSPRGSSGSGGGGEAPLNTLMKHHFSMLYRKRSWRINKEGKLQREKGKRNAVSSTNKSPVRIESSEYASKGNATLFLSVINAGATNHSGLISAGDKSDERASNVHRRRVDNEVAPPPSASASGERRDENNAAASEARVLPLLHSAAKYEATDIDENDPPSTRKTRDDYEEVVGFEVPVFANVTEPSTKNRTVPEMPVGILSVQLVPAKVDKNYVRSTLRLLVNTVKDVIVKYGDSKLAKLLDLPRISCFDFFPVFHDPGNSVMEELTQNLKRAVREALAGRAKLNETHVEESWNSSLAAKFKILNLVPEENIVHNKSGIHLSKMRKVNSTTLESRKWRTIGSMVGEENVHLETIVWPGGDIIPVSSGRGSRSIFRIVTAFAPPFVMIGELDEDGQCLRGIECHQFLTSDKDNLTLLFNEMERTEEEDEVNVLDRIQLEKSKDFWDGGIDDIRSHHFGHKFRTNCCYGLSMDLLENVAEELEFDFQLYIVADGLFGSKTMAESSSESKWSGIVGDLVSGAAHMSFSALSVSSSRAQVIDFSVPYFFSGVSFLAAPKEKSDIPLMAFLLPFSPNLWIAIFTSLHVAAVAVAIYEWLSPFGLNPWGRQRSKNFGLASALWVMWGLLCGHLVQFKAPKSWPNKFLINVWGGFSVIFVASYTANIAALIAGLFFHTQVGDHHDRSLLTQRVGAPKASAAEYYIRSTNQMLWDHMQRYSVGSIGEGVQLLKNGSLDILIADTPILDYYRATDHGCKLQRIGDTINEDTYAVGMMKGFPLKDSISAVIAKYATNGYMDILQEKWYGGLPCFKLATEMAQPRPLGVAAVAGVFIMLGLGVVIGCLILLSEHLFYKYTLPSLRKKPKTSMWKSRNVMFFSQKLYRFINCVELVSPHHAARELVHTLRQGQITSLFQKSVRRKEHEQRQQQRKSKAQFFEMIQEIRRVQQEGRKSVSGMGGRYSPRKKSSHKSSQLLLSPTGLLKHRHRLSPGRLDFARRLSKDVFRSKSSGNLAMARMGSDISVATGRFIDYYGAQAIGRRLSHGTADNSPPDISSRRHSQFLREDYPCLQPSPSSSDLQPDEMEAKPLSSSPSDTNIVVCLRSPPGMTSLQTLAPRRASASIFSRDIGPVAARKFSNVDSSSFKGIKAKLQHKLCAPKLTLNNEDFLSCEGGSCNEHATKPFESSFERTNSVKSTEHVIEILIPSSDDAAEAGTDPRSRSAEASRRHSTLSECERTSGEEPPLGSLEGLADESKPKIILHLPKRKSKRSSSLRAGEHTPLSRLSADELKQLSQLSEKDLKDSLLEALEEKNPT